MPSDPRRPVIPSPSPIQREEWERLRVIVTGPGTSTTNSFWLPDLSSPRPTPQSPAEWTTPSGFAWLARPTGHAHAAPHVIPQPDGPPVIAPPPPPPPVAVEDDDGDDYDDDGDNYDDDDDNYDDEEDE